MNAISRVVLGAILFGTVFVANPAQAGDVTGKLSATGLKSAGNIAVYIDAIPGKKFEPPAQHAIMDQRNITFFPHILVILRGTTVDFLNTDDVAHNVFWPSIGGDKTLRHSLTIVSPGTKKSFRFSDLGAAQLLCNLHPKMLAYIVIVPTPYFVLTDNDGRFLMKNVPPGNYTLKTWSEDGKPTKQTITVTDAATTVDIDVKK